MLTGQNGILNRAGEAKNKTVEVQNKEALEMEILQMYMKYNLNGEAGTFFDYIFTNEKELKQELGTDDVNIDKTTQTIQYKGTTYSISENGSVKATEITKILELSSETITVDEYATETLTAIQEGTEDITWESSDTSVVTVA